MHRFKLDLDDEYEFLVFGISCHLKDYRVAWNLNQALRIDLERKSININTSPGHSHEFSVFQSKDTDYHINFHLLNNYSEDHPLVKSLRQYDYFVLIEGYLELFDKSDFLQNLKSIESFQMVVEEPMHVLSKFQYEIFES